MADSVNNMIFDDVLAKSVGPGGIFINRSNGEVGNGHKLDFFGLNNINGPKKTEGYLSTKPNGLMEGEIGLNEGMGQDLDKGPIKNKKVDIQTKLSGGDRDLKQNYGHDATSTSDDTTETALSSFDGLCRKLKNSKILRKYMRAVFELGEKVENFIYPVEYSVAAASKEIPGSNLFIPNNCLYMDFPLSSNSITHSRILNCNSRIHKGGLGNMSVGMRNAMNRLGITTVSDAYDPISKIQELERRDFTEA